MASTSTLRYWWAQYRCDPNRLEPIELFGSNAGRVPPETMEAYQALEQVLTATGYEPSSVWTYNCRKIAGTNSWSLHSYGLAVDIDPASNPYSRGDQFVGKFKPEHILPIEAIRNTTGGQIWFWGGRWSRPDRMHFQINQHPNNCEVDWATVEGTETVETLKLGDSGWGVNRLQKALNGWAELQAPDLIPLEVDGEYGADTQARVALFQNGSKLPERFPRGIVGGITWGWLMEYVPDKIDKDCLPTAFDARIVPL